MRLLKNPWAKAFIAVLFFVFVFLALRFLKIEYSKVSAETLRNKILSFGIWAPVIYIVFYSLRPLILLPAGILSITGGFVFGLFFGTIYTVIGATICATWEFFVARYFGREAVSRFIKGKFLDLDEAIASHGLRTVLLVRLIPNVAYDIQNCTLGLTKIRFKTYLFATLIGIIPGTVVFVYLGHSLSDFKHFWKIAAAVSIITAIYLVQAKFRRLKKRTV